MCAWMQSGCRPTLVHDIAAQLQQQHHPTAAASQPMACRTYQVQGGEQVIIVAHEVHLAHCCQCLLLRQVVWPGAEAQALASHSHRAAAGRGWGARRGWVRHSGWVLSGGAGGSARRGAGSRRTGGFRPRRLPRPHVAGTWEGEPPCACRHPAATRQPCMHGWRAMQCTRKVCTGRTGNEKILPPATCCTPHLDTMMTLKPRALRSRAVSTMEASEDRFREPCSARISEDVPTLITCAAVGAAGVVLSGSRWLVSAGNASCQLWRA